MCFRDLGLDEKCARGGKDLRFLCVRKLWKMIKKDENWGGDLFI